ncbi:MAG TPA: alcohol dehydrogenase, partial [Dehalococcoidia bacterium]|nr:alcohol dehydrogenase [Dehalococcoidia bacterium]
MKAAIFHGPHQPLTIEEVDIDDPGPREVIVKTAASGVCHSDLHYVDGAWSFDTPAILGHEAAGIVELVGEQVTYVQPGDHVICCPSVFCGMCERCMTGQPYACDREAVTRSAEEPPKYTWNGQGVAQFAHLSTYAEKMLVHENAIVRIREDMPLDAAALIGCGVTTGFGAVVNTAKVQPGSSVAVFGVGGVGLAAVQGSLVAGARMIIAVDTVESKLAKARELGATHVVDASSNDPVQAIHDLTGGGADHTFEA